MTTAGLKRKEKQAEVNKWKELATPYATVLLLVIRSDAPYTEEDFIVYRQIRRFWGGKGSTKERLVVVFTFAEGEDVVEVGERMESGSPKWMGKVLGDSGGRYLVFKGKVSHCGYRSCRCYFLWAWVRVSVLKARVSHCG